LQGAPWQILRERLEILGEHGGPDYELLFAELALGRGLEVIGLRHAQLARAAGADPLRCYLLGGPHLPSLEQETGARRTVGLACVALRAGRAQDTIRLLAEPLAADAPAFLQRSRWTLLVMASSSLPGRLAQAYEEQALRELGLSQSLVPFLSSWRMMLLELSRGAVSQLTAYLPRLVSLLRIDEAPSSRVRLATLLALLPEPLRRAWAASNALWVAEAEAALRAARAGAATSPVEAGLADRLQQELAHLRGIQRLSEGRPREEVEAAWGDYGPPRGEWRQVVQERYRERFSREPGR